MLFSVSVRVLFICSQNKYRSKVAEVLFKDKFETRSAGLHGGKEVTAADLNWADVIAVMEEEHRLELVKIFPEECKSKRVLTLDIPDYLSSAELAEVLQRKVRDVLEK